MLITKTSFRADCRSAAEKLMPIFRQMGWIPHEILNTGSPELYIMDKVSVICHGLSDHAIQVREGHLMAQWFDEESVGMVIKLYVAV
jgi:hypothetical protein